MRSTSSGDVSTRRRRAPGMHGRLSRLFTGPYEADPCSAFPTFALLYKVNSKAAKSQAEKSSNSRFLFHVRGDFSETVGFSGLAFRGVVD